MLLFTNELEISTPTTNAAIAKKLQDLSIEGNLISGRRAIQSSEWHMDELVQKGYMSHCDECGEVAEDLKPLKQQSLCPSCYQLLNTKGE